MLRSWIMCSSMQYAMPADGRANVNAAIHALEFDVGPAAADAAADAMIAPLERPAEVARYTAVYGAGREVGVGPIGKGEPDAAVHGVQRNGGRPLELVEA